MQTKATTHFVFNLINVRKVLPLPLQDTLAQKNESALPPSCTCTYKTDTTAACFQTSRWQPVFLRLMTFHTTHNQHRPPGLQTLPLFSKPSGPHSLGGTKHLAQSFIFLSGVPPQRCTGLIHTHIRRRIGILFFQ